MGSERPCCSRSPRRSAPHGARARGHRVTATTASRRPSVATSRCRPSRRPRLETFDAKLEGDELDYRLEPRGSTNSSSSPISTSRGLTSPAASSCSLCGGGGKPACPTDGVVEDTIVPANVQGPTDKGISAGDFAALVNAMRNGATYVNATRTSTSPARSGGTSRATTDVASTTSPRTPPAPPAGGVLSMSGLADNGATTTPRYRRRGRALAATLQRGGRRGPRPGRGLCRSPIRPVAFGIDAEPSPTHEPTSAVVTAPSPRLSPIAGSSPEPTPVPSRPSSDAWHPSGSMLRARELPCRRPRRRHGLQSAMSSAIPTSSPVGRPPSASTRRPTAGRKPRV